MAVHWLIDSQSRRVVVMAEGRARVPTYAKIFDDTVGENAITTEDMALFAARFRRLHAEPHGPLAIVLPPPGARV